MEVAGFDVTVMSCHVIGRGKKECIGGRFGERAFYWEKGKGKGKRCYY